MTPRIRPLSTAWLAQSSTACSPAGPSTVSGLPTYRPNLIGDPVIPSSERASRTLVLDPAMVEIPTDRSRPFGNAPRNSVRSDPFRQFDLGLHKAFGLGRDQTRLEARIEAFNLFNTTNFGMPENNFDSLDFGKITSTVGGPRVSQFGLRITF